LAPVLAALEKVDGVKSAMANHSGSMVRISLSESANADAVSKELKKILKKQGRKPRQMSGEELAKAIESEQWRATEEIGELSEIEFRTVFERRVKAFAEKSDLDESTIAKLLEYSKEVLEETPASDSETQWADFCNGLSSRMIEKARDVLTDEQLKTLAKKIKARVIG